MGDRGAGPVPHNPGEPAVGETIGPYSVMREVARGGMATVLAVRDGRTGRVLGMKLLLPMPRAEEAKNRFRREFRALSKLRHENILKVYEWGWHGDRPWFTMELVEGRTLAAEADALQEFEAVDRAAQSVHIVVQVARALAWVHERGLVHRDVTPGNIMITPEGTVKLMDFGVVKDLGAELTIAGEVLGTAAYIAPEQIIGEHVDARADLYSLGAVFYLLLTGHRPFAALTMQGLLDKHMHQRPKAPSEHDSHLPPHLDEVVMRLLSKEPSDRYASAAHLLHVLGDTSTVAEAKWWPPATVGRTRAQAVLQEAMDEAERRRPGAAIRLVGDEGFGKSRLLDIAERYALQRGLTVGRGRCRPQDRPFGAFFKVYRALRSENPAAILDVVLGGRDEGRVFERYPVLAAFRDLVLKCAPCAILLDDVDCADAATVDLLEFLIRNTLELQKAAVVFVVAMTPVRSALDEIGLVQTIELARLDAAEVEELVLSLTDSSPAARALADRIHEESGGLPSYASDMLRGLVDEGVLLPSKSGARERFVLSLDESGVSQSLLPMPASMRHALEERIAPLSAAAREVVTTLAVSRHSLDLDTLVSAADCGEEDVVEALDELEDSGIVMTSRRDDLERVELSQARLRDVLLVGDTSARHRRMGEALEQSYRNRVGEIVEELAYHFERADVPAKAYRYLLLTANRHLNRSLFEESLQFLDRALALEPTARPRMLLEEADRHLAELYLARSQAKLATGHTADALEDVRRAEELASQLDAPKLLSKVATEHGRQLRGLGRAADAEQKLRDALDASHKSGDLALRPLPLYQLGGILWGRGDLDGAETVWRESAEIAERIGDERAQGSAYNGLGILAICRGRTMDARGHLERSAELFERLGMVGLLAITRVNLVELYLSTGILKKALALADTTVSQAREVGHPHGLGLGLAWRAAVLAALGRFDEARAEGALARSAVRGLGTSPEDELFVLATSSQVALQAGSPASALELVEELIPLLEGFDYEGVEPQVTAWHSRALSELGRPDDAARVLDAGHRLTDQWPHVQVRTDLAWARAQQLLGRTDAARSLFQDALRVAEANGYRYYQLLSHHGLVRVTSAEEAARHERVAASLARSLAASLARTDADSFLSQFAV